MAKYGEHFPTIERMLPALSEQLREKNIDFLYEYDRTDPHERHYRFFFKQDDLEIQRTVIVTEIDRINMFNVTLEEARRDPDFIVSTETRQYDADSVRDMHFALGQMMQFLQRAIDHKRFPTPKMIEHVATINRNQFQSTECQAELHFVSDDYDDLWKIQLVNRHNRKEVYANHLPVDISSLMCGIIVRTYGRGYTKGRITATVSIAEHLGHDRLNEVIQRTHIKSYEVANEHPALSDFLRKGHLR